MPAARHGRQSSSKYKHVHYSSNHPKARPWKASSCYAGVKRHFGHYASAEGAALAVARQLNSVDDDDDDEEEEEEEDQQQEEKEDGTSGGRNFSEVEDDMILQLKSHGRSWDKIVKAMAEVGCPRTKTSLQKRYHRYLKSVRKEEEAEEVAAEVAASSSKKRKLAQAASSSASKRPASTAAPAVPAPPPVAPLAGPSRGGAAASSSSSTQPVAPAGMAAVSAMLTEHGLAQYVDAFEDLGYDNAAFLRSRTEQVLEEIANEANMKPGHRRMFVTYMLER